MRKIKKLLSSAISIALSAAIAGSSFLMADAGLLYEGEYTKDIVSTYFIISLDGKAISEYQQAREMGVRDFILSEDGKNAYEEIIGDHVKAQEKIAELIGRKPEVEYEYTAATNGFSIALSENEANLIIQNKDKLGVSYISAGSPVQKNSVNVKSEKQNQNQKNSREGTYEDLTEKIFEETGITQSGLDGDGIVIAIIDNEFDYSHEYLTAPSGFKGKYSKSDIKEVYPYLSAGPYVSDTCYMNEKIPYRFNYSKKSFDTNDNVYSHGTHVAGIASGNGENETSKLYDPKGTAPDSQLLLLSDCNFFDDSLLAAYDDVLYLGADVVNASYGLVGATVKTSKASTEAINNIANTGTIFCVAAGNDGKFDYFGNIFTDYSTGGYPDNVNGAVSVGSAENIAVEVCNDFVTLSDGSTETILDGALGLAACYDNYSFEYVPVPGYGEMEDFENIDVSGKIALIKRGQTLFSEKVSNAADAGAKGVIIYNNDDSDLMRMDSDSLPCAMISLQAGQKLMKLSDKKLTISSGMPVIEIDDNINMSDFSTWDFTEQLLLKPDISAFGGKIISSVADDNNSHKSYETYSGTSMACPQMTGISALLKQYITANPEKYSVTARCDYSELAAKLLMSTAKPIYTSDDMEIASPRVQGNGLANIYNAINTPCYISSNSEIDNFRPKISLGDGYKQSYSLEFNVTNISEKNCTYALSTDLFKDQVNEDGSLCWNTLRLTSGKDYTITYTDEKGKKIENVNSAAGSTVKVFAEIKISDEVYNKIKTDGGRFVDGFVRLTSSENPNLTLSFMAYCGNWADSNGTDVLVEFGYENPEALYASLLCDSNLNPAGVNILDWAVSAPAFSPAETDTENVFNELALNLIFKRRCYDLNATIYNSAGQKVYEEFIADTAERCIGTYGPSSNAYILNWDFKENGAVKNNAKYTVELSAAIPLSDKSIVIGSQEFIVDIEKPVVKSVRKLSTYSGEFIIIEASDNVQLQGAVCSDFNAASVNASTSGKYIIMPVDDDVNGYVEVYDTAGNYTTVSVDVSDEDELVLNAGNSFGYASTDEDDFFSGKVQVEDKNGKKADLEIFGDVTPEEAYENYGNGEFDATLYIDGFEIESYLVNAGIKGDANLDGVCNVRDAAYIAHLMANKSSNEYFMFMESVAGYCTDVNDDDNVNIRDAAAIAYMLVHQ